MYHLTYVWSTLLFEEDCLLIANLFNQIMKIMIMQIHLIPDVGMFSHLGYIGLIINQIFTQIFTVW